MLYPRSTVIVTVNSRFVTPQLRKNFNTKLVLLGVQPDRQEDLIETYAKLTNTDIEVYTGKHSHYTEYVYIKVTVNWRFAPTETLYSETKMQKQ